MSGVEVFGLIGTTITIIEATIKVYDAIKDLHGLPDTFRQVSDRLPLVKAILVDAEKEETTEEANPMSSKEATSLMKTIESCKKKFEKLQNIFTKIQRSSSSTSISVYRSLVLKLGKESRVEALMSDILKDLQVLVAHRAFQPSTQKHIKEVEKARQELDKVPPSLPDSNFYEAPKLAQQTAGRDMYNNTNTGPGTQRNVVGSSYEGNNYIGSPRLLADPRWLDPEVTKRNIEDIKGIPEKQSYDWILKHAEFRKWYRDENSKLFLIKGGPGKGKTMLLCGIIEELRNTIPADQLSFFFCQGTDSRLNNATAVLRGLVYRLARNNSTLGKRLQETYSHAPQKLFEDGAAFDTLRGIVLDFLEESSSTRLFLIIDALDECKTDLQELLKFINRIARKSSCVKWILTSRVVENELTRNDGLVPLVLEENQEPVSKAVGEYIERKVRNLRFLEEEQEEAVARRVQERANGTFLWVSFVLNELEKLDRSTGIQFMEMKLNPLNLVEQLPGDLEDFYHRMISGIRALPGEDQQLCSSIISTVVLAYRPLHLRELGVLSGAKTSISEKPHIFREFIPMCGSFLSIGKDDYIYLVHQSAKDYLLSKGSAAVFPFGRLEVHYDMFSRSLDAMSRVLKHDIYGLHDHGLQRSEIKVADKDPLAAVRYSCVYWVDHLCEVHSNKTTFLQSLYLYCLITVALIDNISAKIFALSRIVTFLEAHLATYICWMGRKSLQYQRDLDDNGMVHTFLRNFFLNWLESLSLLEAMPKAFTVLTDLQCMISVDRQSGLYSIVSDARSFTLNFRSIIEKAPLQIYGSALIFSPAMSIISNLFLKEVPTWIKNAKISAVEENWTPRSHILEGHTGDVFAVAFSPNRDGNLIASGSIDRTVRLWNYSTGVALHTLKGHSDVVRHLVFSPDGSQLASGSGSTIHLWDPTTGTKLYRLDGHADQIHALAFAPKGNQLASGSSDYTVRLWNPSTGALLHILGCEPNVDNSLEGNDIYDMAFSSDGRQLATGSPNGKIHLWNLSTKGVRELHSSSAIHTMALSSTGCQLASVSGGGVQIWDPLTGEILHRLNDHKGTVTHVVFSPNGKQLVSGASDGTIRFWDPVIGTMLREVHTDSDVNGLAFSPDGSQLASCSDITVGLWDVATGIMRQKLEGHTERVYAVAFSPDGSRLASGSYDHTVRLWDTTTEAVPLAKVDSSHGAEQVVFSPDGSKLVSISKGGTIQVWSPATGACLHSMVDDECYCTVVAFSPDGNWLASGSSRYGTILLWDLATGAQLKRLDDPSRPDRLPFPAASGWLAVSPDGSQLASGSSFVDWKVRLWDAASGTLLHMLRGHRGRVRVVKFSSDGSQLASGSDDDTVRFWDTTTGTTLHVLLGTGKADVLTFSHDGRQLAVCSEQMIGLWCTATGTVLHKLKDFIRYDSLGALVFSPDGSQLASGPHDDYTVRLWDTKIGAMLRTLKCHPHLVIAAAYYLFQDEQHPLDLDETGRWVIRNKRKVVLLPPDRKASACAVRGNKLVIGHYSGGVTFLEFDLTHA
ncbi:WD40-repeat-containing domain protein [Xylaria telfairii]|nr:WD40-repeat-containing domain protein [Xylaria telfairii]